MFCLFSQRKRVNFPDPPTTSEKLIPIEEKTAKKCKKQLIMTTNDLEAVIAPEIETDSSSVDVKPCIEELMREAETQTVPPEESTTANDYFVEAKNSWMKAIKAIVSINMWFVCVCVCKLFFNTYRTKTMKMTSVF